MAVELGTRFGSYEVTEAIGAGGMGEVFRATDTTLERDVALKVLPASFAEDADRVTRFEREAKTLAALNHPNIAQIYGLEKSGGTTALVMELVDGATLEERIAKGPIPADEALGIAMQIADALEAAHSQSIVHRDLKPANIKLKADGTVKVLDFGIAKALAAESLTSEPQSPIMTTPATQVGVILGTAAYMSPEQAKGKAIDQRTDIWAFGCVLYEMLTGQLAFGAEDVPTTLARVIANETKLDALPAGLSPNVGQTITACLQKDLRLRIADVRDVRLALAGAFTPKASAELAQHDTSGVILRRRLAVVGAIVAGAAATAIFALSIWPESPETPIRRFDYDIPVGHFLRASGRPVFDLASDGRHFIFNTNQGIYLRPMDELEARVIPGTEQFLTSSILSPDGQAVAFWEFGSHDIARVAISGGATVTIASDVGENPNGMSWTTTGDLLVGQPQGIFRVSVNGGPLEPVISSEQDDELFFGPRLLPDGDHVLFSITEASTGYDWNEARIVIESLSSGERTTLVERGSDARYLPTGHIVYALGDALFAVAFDLESLSVASGPVSLLQGVMRATANLTGAANFAVSDDGSLVYLTGQRATASQTLVWVDRDGVESATNLEPSSYTSVKFSPDQRRVALDTFDASMDVWIWDLVQSSPQRLTRSQTLNGTPLWTPDGQRIVWSRAITGTLQEVATLAADGSGWPPRELTVGSYFPVRPSDITPDGSSLLYSEYLPPRDIWIISMDGPPTNGRQLLATEAEETAAKISPNGRWLAYQSDVSGRNEIYVAPFPDVETRRWQISNGGGTMPIWSPDGEELFYYLPQSQSQGSFMVVPIELEPEFSHGAPQLLFEGPYVPPLGIVATSDSFYDVTSDGERFLIIKSATEAGTLSARTGSVNSPRAVIVENWFAELERLVPTQ